MSDGSVRGQSGGRESLPSGAKASNLSQGLNPTAEAVDLTKQESALLVPRLKLGVFTKARGVKRSQRAALEEALGAAEVTGGANVG